MTYPEAIGHLYGLRWFGTKLGLENTRRLAELAGSPHEKLQFIHVAGTNGKGSTCAMLEAIYRAAGLRVGLFTSPHLIAFGERIQVNREPLSETGTVELLRELLPLLNTFPEEHHPTFFETVVVMALRHFAKEQCDLVVWETGLGGRLDATNIVTPLVSVITNIQYDHQKWLGETLESIAGEKAGIIKPGVPCVTGAQAEEALRVIRRVAAERHSALTEVKPEACGGPPLDRVRLPLVGEHQRMNAAVTAATVRVLSGRLAVTEDQVAGGLSNVYWPGRLQVLQERGGRRVVLDGAHNEGGARVLAKTLVAEFPGDKPTLVLGILRDKDWRLICDILAPAARRIVVAPVASERTGDPRELAAACRRANPGTEVVETDSLPEALAATAGESLVVITGSLYLVGEAMELLNISVAGRGSERHLNEWSGEPERQV